MPAASSSIARRSAGLAAITAPIRPWLTKAGEWAPVAASANSSWTSRPRTSRPSSRYADPAPRSIRRTTSRSSAPSAAAASISSDTSAKSRGGRVVVPAKMTSSIPAPRSDLAEPSPIVQRSASRRFDLPQPLGPTTPVSPRSIGRSTGSTKLLNPAIRRRLICISCRLADRDRRATTHLPRNAREAKFRPPPAATLPGAGPS